jgi:hypothetical protein
MIRLPNSVLNSLLTIVVLIIIATVIEFLEGATPTEGLGLTLFIFTAQTACIVLPLVTIKVLGADTRWSIQQALFIGIIFYTAFVLWAFPGINAWSLVPVSLSGLFLIAREIHRDQVAKKVDWSKKVKVTTADGVLYFEEPDKDDFRRYRLERDHLDPDIGAAKVLGSSFMGKNREVDIAQMHKPPLTRETLFIQFRSGGIQFYIGVQSINQVKS